MAGEVINYLFGPPGNPEPGVPFSDAVARKLGFTDPLGKSTYYASFKSSYPSRVTERTGPLYPMLREEMVSKLAEE